MKRHSLRGVGVAVGAAVLMFALTGCGYLEYFLGVGGGEEAADDPDVMTVEQAQERIAELEQRIAELEGGAGGDGGADGSGGSGGGADSGSGGDGAGSGGEGGAGGSDDGGAQGQGQGSSGGSGDDTGTAAKGLEFPFKFTATDIYGNEVTEASLGDKEIYFIHLWGTWCPPCVAEMPEFPALIEQYGDRVGFLALLDDYDDNRSGAVNIAQSAGIPESFIMIDAYEADILLLTLQLSSGYVPTSIVFSADGYSEQIIGSYGAGYAEFLEEALR